MQFQQHKKEHLWSLSCSPLGIGHQSWYPYVLQASGAVSLMAQGRDALGEEDVTMGLGSEEAGSLQSIIQELGKRTLRMKTRMTHEG